MGGVEVIGQLFFNTLYRCGLFINLSEKLHILRFLCLVFVFILSLVTRITLCNFVLEKVRVIYWRFVLCSNCCSPCVVYLYKLLFFL